MAPVTLATLLSVLAVVLLTATAMEEQSTSRLPVSEENNYVVLASVFAHQRITPFPSNQTFLGLPLTSVLPGYHVCYKLYCRSHLMFLTLYRTCSRTTYGCVCITL